MKDEKFLRSILINSVFFCAAAVCAAFIGKMIITDTEYQSLSPGGSLNGIGDVIRLVSDASSWSLLQLMIIFGAGFSLVSQLVSVGISLIRGTVLGYSLASFSLGCVTSRGIVQASVLFCLSSIAVIMFSSASASFSAYCREEGIGFQAFLKYLAVFLTVSGFVAVLDSIRLLFL